jgi:hypothetical protein
VLGLSASVAYAGEGSGEPFPGPDAAVVSKVAPNGIVSGNDDPFHYNGAVAATRTNTFKLNPNNPDDPFPFHVASKVVPMPAPGVGPDSRARVAAHTVPMSSNHS